MKTASSAPDGSYEPSISGGAGIAHLPVNGAPLACAAGDSPADDDYKSSALPDKIDQKSIATREELKLQLADRRDRWVGHVYRALLIQCADKDSQSGRLPGFRMSDQMLLAEAKYLVLQYEARQLELWDLRSGQQPRYSAFGEKNPQT